MHYGADPPGSSHFRLGNSLPNFQDLSAHCDIQDVVKCGKLNGQPGVANNKHRHTAVAKCRHPQLEAPNPYQQPEDDPLPPESPPPRGARLWRSLCHRVNPSCWAPASRRNVPVVVGFASRRRGSRHIKRTPLHFLKPYPRISDAPRSVQTSSFFFRLDAILGFISLADFVGAS